MVMNKTKYYFISIVMAFGLICGGFVNTQALSKSLTLKTQDVRMLIPLYIDPSGSVWSNVVNANFYNNIDVIINPRDGVGRSQSAIYTKGVKQLRAGKVGIYGYVYTSWGTRPLKTVKAEIDKWQLWYNVDGIFLDEASESTSNLFYYSDLWNYIAAKGMRVILNPGANTDETYTIVSDSIVIYENIPSHILSVSLWAADYPSSKFAALQFGSSVQQMRDFVAFAKANNIGYIYVTNDIPPNPWNKLPPYLAEEAALLAGGPIPPTPSPIFTPSFTPSKILTFIPTKTSTWTLIPTSTPKPY
jgi:hypothetical protein